MLNYRKSNKDETIVNFALTTAVHIHANKVFLFLFLL